MKRLSLFLALVLSCSVLFSQVEEVEILMSQGTNTALTIPLRKTNLKEVETAWTKFVKEYKGKTKKNKKTGEIFSDNASIKEMGTNTVDIYTKVIAKSEDTELRVWFDLGGAYLNNTAHPEKYTKAVTMLETFALTVSTAALEEQIEEQASLVKKMTGDLESLKKDQSNAEADIAKYEKKIEEAKAQIQEAIEGQKTKEVEIAEQEVVLKELQTKLSEVK